MGTSERPATLRDVAGAAGVHPATASRALNPSTRLLVSEETAQRVLAAASRLGYSPNPVARSLRTRRSDTIGVLIPDLNNPLFPPMVRGVEDRLAEQGYVALIGNTDGDERRERMVFDQMRARHVDGFVLATATLRHPILDEAVEADLPVVLMNRTARGYPFSSVSADNQAGARAAVAYVASLGHTRIGHVGGPQGISTSVARLHGFQDEMRDSGLELSEDQVIHATAYSIEEGNRSCSELLGRRGDLTAIVAANDLLAIGCYEALDGLGLRCPEDISVIGFNDMPFVDRLRPPLSTIRFSHHQMGVDAATLLLERIDGSGGAAQVRFLAPELMVRGSTAPPAPMVALRPALRILTAFPALCRHCQAQAL
ncbi:MAG TPA: LacI family DNA-binding transcriptional regulator [Trebonia sp.]|jgi:LacI family transcriptional regulator|nr:LacI family DNA-binding transcriptional regulator [Trebonia sp.]